jgi:AcrR family transcriptional regulator
MQTPSPTTPSGRRRLQQRAEARGAILAAADALLVKDGYERFSMRRLADRCGYTAPTIYHYFGDKQGLIDAVVEGRLKLVLTRVRRVRRRSDPVDTLRAMLLEIARFGLEDPTHHRILNIPRPASAPQPPSGEKVRELLAGPLAELAAAGRLRGRDVERAEQFLWVLVHGVVSLHTSQPDHPWAKDIVRYSIETALSGLSPSERAAPGAARGRGAA